MRKISCVLTHAIWTVLPNNVCSIYFFRRMRKSHAIIRSEKIAKHPIWMYPYACVIFDAIIRNEKTQRILSECTLSNEHGVMQPLMPYVLRISKTSWVFGQLVNYSRRFYKTRKSIFWHSWQFGKTPKAIWSRSSQALVRPWMIYSFEFKIPWRKSRKRSYHTVHVFTANM